MKRYTQKQIDEAVRQVTENNIPAAQVARLMGISKSCIGKWVRKQHGNGNEDRLSQRKVRDLIVAMERTGIKNEILQKAHHV